MAEIQALKDSMKFEVPVASAVLSIFGTLANSASLAYFIKKEEKGIGDKLLMLLNSIDLLLCITATAFTCIYSSILKLHNMDKPVSQEIIVAIILLFAIYMLLMDGTAFVTCLLSVTRGIGIAFPFYQIKGKLLVIVGVVVFLVMELSSILTTIFTPDNYYGALLSRLGMGSLMILVVVSASVVSVYNLARNDLQGAAERMNRNNRKATWTVVILSALFFVFNFILLGAMAAILVISLESLDPESSSFSFLFYLLNLGILFAIPLNSTMNPIVYLLRRSDMRNFLKECLPRLSNIMQ